MNRMQALKTLSRRTLAMLALGCAALSCATFALAQEGHPLKGSWRGEWKPGQGEEQHVRVQFDYAGTKLSGAINPGRNAMPFTAATLNPDNWTVHLEADSKDGQHIVIDGKLDNIGSYNRTLSGTWQQGAQKGNFKITRD